MPYWGSKPDENDFAFDAIGVYILLIKEWMMKDISRVLEKAFPEQAIIASLNVLRLIGERFPKNLSVHFGKKDYAFAKKSFEAWYATVKDKLPAKHRAAILVEAEKEFALFEERILKRYERA